MILKDYKQSYYDLSSLSSSVTRQAAFAGIALVWIFKNTSANMVTLPEQLLLPTLLLIACLACDLLQYIVGSAIWGFFHRYHEAKGVQPDDVIRAPRWLNWPALVLYWAKHLFVVMGYAGMINFLVVSIQFVE